MSQELTVKWIAVEERLPPCAETVLAYVPETGKRLRAFYVCADYDPKLKGWFEDGAYGGQDWVEHRVTHWMELPTAPVCVRASTQSGEDHG